MQADIQEFLPNMPAVAAEHFAKNQVVQSEIDYGVSRIRPSGHTGGIAYRFYIHHIYNGKASADGDLAVHDDIEMIQFFKSKRSRPCEQVRFLPDELLRFNKSGHCIGGELKEAYLRWKAGEEAIGTPLGSWGVLTSGKVATLESIGIFTVEQFAERPREEIETYPESIVQAYERARIYVASMKEQRGEASYLAATAELEEKHKKVMASINKLAEKMGISADELIEGDFTVETPAETKSKKGK